MLDTKLDSLADELRRLDRVVVAFSGGADSAFLAAVAHRTLGARAHAVTAVSPSLAGAEHDDCRALSEEWGLRWTPVETHEMERAAYRINDTDRCFHCKAELMDVVAPIAAAEQATVVLGVNTDDLERPPAGAAGGAGGRRRVPARRRRVLEGRRACRVAGARVANVGQAGGGMPREPHPSWHAGDASDCCRPSIAPKRR